MLSIMWRNVSAMLKYEVPFKFQCARFGMNADEFKSRCKQVIDYIVNYHETVAARKVAPDVKLGYLRKCMPSNPPKCRECFDEIMRDMEEKIMPGVLHWNHPRFFAYFPSAYSYASHLAEMFCDHSAALNFGEWQMHPTCVEMDEIMTDWYAKAMGLPCDYLHECGPGGGFISNTASEAIFKAILIARYHAIKVLKNDQEDVNDNYFLPKLVAYCSTDAHSSVEKAMNIALVKKRILEADDKGVLSGCTLQKAMEEDLACGLVPFFVVGTAGTTSTAAFDKLKEIGAVIRNYPNVWFHVDGAYGGNFFLLPEMRFLMDGIEYSDSLDVNPKKGMLCNMDCEAFYVKDKKKFEEAFNVTPPYCDYGLIKNCKKVNTQMQMSSRFRSLKLWYVFRSYGIEGLQLHLRKIRCHAQCFKALVKQDERFELTNDVLCGLVCFKLRNVNDELNEELYNSINNEREINVTKSHKDGVTIRWCMDYEFSSEDDVYYSWQVIQKHAEKILHSRRRLS